MKVKVKSNPVDEKRKLYYCGHCLALLFNDRAKPKELPQTCPQCGERLEWDEGY